MSFNNKLNKKDLRKVYWRYFALNCMNDYPGQMHSGFTYAMIPALRKIYKDDEQKKIEAYQRHTSEYFNVTPYICGMPLGVVLAMEEENANTEEFDTSSITGIKTALMGPLSAIGDTLFHSTLRIIATAMVIDLANQGSWLAPVIFLLAFNIPNVIARWYSLSAGYKMGTGFLAKAESSGIMEKISYAASVVGLMAIGAMTATNVNVTTALSFGGGIGEETTVQVQALLDTIMPRILPLGLVLLCYWLLGKKVGVVPMLLGLLVAGVILFAFGIIA